MSIIKHELRLGFKSFLIWSVSISFLMCICILMFPELKVQMFDANEMFSSMGSFTNAFGMDRLNIGTFIGFYVIECGNMIGLGGAFFASLIAISSLSKEEKDGTAEFLLAHPISRNKIVTEKLIAVFIQIILMNLFVVFLSMMFTLFIGEVIPVKEIFLQHLAFLFMHIELAAICFCISSFISFNGVGIGMGISILMYFLNLISNISSNLEFLKYITPFGYTDGADIVTNLSINFVYLIIGFIVTVISIILAFIKYSKKDIH